MLCWFQHLQQWCFSTMYSGPVCQDPECICDVHTYIFNFYFSSDRSIGFLQERTSIFYFAKYIDFVHDGGCPIKKVYKKNRWCYLPRIFQKKSAAYMSWKKWQVPSPQSPYNSAPSNKAPITVTTTTGKDHHAALITAAATNNSPKKQFYILVFLLPICPFVAQKFMIGSDSSSEIAIISSAVNHPNMLSHLLNCNSLALTLPLSCLFLG